MMKCIQQKRRQLRSFTLVELLIVIAIIGILLTILLPSLSEARKTSQRAVCLSNLKTFHSAAHLYTVDRNGRFPTHIDPYDHHNGRTWIGKKGIGKFKLEVTKRPLNKYIGLTKDGMEAPQMKCPFNEMDEDVYDKVGSSYVANDYDGWRGGINGLFLAKINNPSKVVLSTEYGTMAFVFHENMQDLWRQTHYLGKPRYPFVMIDGHATHHKIFKDEGIAFESENIIFNIRNFD
ncbi:MAG: prepilin-type N-terminal cleavage/methylation domain-containing protein [Lentisphaeraceae bacterium]|nr:prepilin-type N-terminal cleavage/methylation domain-containing protein [Lentisphaeraceae bacterium]